MVYKQKPQRQSTWDYTSRRVFDNKEMTSSYRMLVFQEKAGVLFRSTDSKELLVLVGVSQARCLSPVLQHQPARQLLHMAVELANSYQTIAAFVGRWRR